MTKKIVIVDDEPHVRALLEQTLEDLEDDYNVEIFSATDGQEGLDLIRQEKPALVFLDVMMPRLNGYQVCQAVKQDPAFAQTTVILVTAKGQEMDRQAGLEAGASRYITKPFDPDEVLATAKEILQLA